MLLRSLRDWVAWTAQRYATRVTRPFPGIAFLVREHTKRSDGEARQRVLGQSAELREPFEAAVVRPTLPFLVQRQRALQQQLAHELRVACRCGERDNGRAAVRAARIRPYGGQVSSRGGCCPRKPFRLRPQQHQLLVPDDRDRRADTRVRTRAMRRG